MGRFVDVFFPILDSFLFPDSPPEFIDSCFKCHRYPPPEELPVPFHFAQSVDE